jgi:hypothetical protein
MSSIVRLARSPQGRRAASHAMRYARSPAGRARMDAVRRQIVARRQGRTRAR